MITIDPQQVLIFSGLWLLIGMVFGAVYIQSDEDMVDNNLAMFFRHVVTSWPIFIAVSLGMKLVRFLRKGGNNE